MKKVVALVVFILSLFIVVSCDEKSKVDFTIDGIEGYSNAIIDNEEKSITLSVNNDVTSFDTALILLPDELDANVYSDEALTNEVDTILPLEVGLNVYYIEVFYDTGEELLTEVYTLKITRAGIPVKEISVSSLKDTYYVNDEFTNGVLKVLYLDGKSEDVTLTKEMVTGFDTSKTGEFTLIVTYQGLTTTFKYKVVEALKLKAIEVKEVSTIYYLNSDFKEGILTLKYDNDTAKEIPLTKEMISDFDTTTLGEKTAKVTYEGLTTTFAYEVVLSEEVLSISVKELKNEYYIGEDFVNGKLLVTFTDNQTKEVDLTISMVEGFSTLEAKEIEIKITYLDKTISYKINVKADNVKEIKVKELKATYYLNDSFKEGILTVIYDSNKSLDITLTKEMVEGFDTSKTGNKTLIITYGKSINYDITVNEDKLLSIKVKELVNEYLINDSFKEGFLTLNYESGKTKDIVLTEEMIEGFDTSSVGEKTLTISYQNLEVQYIINVIDDYVVEIEIGKVNFEYYVGDTYGTNTIVLVHHSGKRLEVEITSPMVSGFTTEVQNDNLTIKITYEKFSLEYNVKVKEDKAIKHELINFKNTYYVDEEFKNGSIRLYYESGKTEVHNILKENVANFDSSKVTKQTLFINVNGYEFNEVIEIIEDEILEIKVKEFIYNYQLNDSFKEGLLTVIYASGKEDEVKITSNMLEGFDTATTGTKEVTINYEGKSITVNIVVDKATVLSIDVVSLKNEYYQNEEFEEGILKINYSDNTSVETALVLAYVTNFDTSNVGKLTLNISYNDVTTTYEINVIEDVLESIEVVSLNNNYIVGDLFSEGILRLNYMSGNVEDIPLTKEMVSGFDTTSTGQKEATITYEDKEVKFSYTVNELEITKLVLKEFNTTYYLNDKFVNGILEVTYMNNNKEEVELTLEMVEGFGTQKTGTFPIKINYKGYVLEAFFYVKSSLYPEDFEMPAMTKIDSNLLKNLFVFKAMFVDGVGSNNGNYEDYYNACKEYVDANIDYQMLTYIKGILEVAGITNNDMLEFNELLEGGIFEDFYNFMMSNMTVTEDFVINIKNALRVVMDLLTPNQIAIIVSELVISANPYVYHGGVSCKEDVYDDGYKINAYPLADYKQILEDLNNPLLAPVITTIEEILTVKREYTFISYDLFKNVAENIYSIIEGVLNVNNEDILNAFNIGIGMNTGQSYTEEDINNFIVAICNGLEEILKTTNNLADIDNLIDLFLNFSYDGEMENETAAMTDLFDLVKGLRPHLNVIVNIIKQSPGLMIPFFEDMFGYQATAENFIKYANAYGEVFVIVKDDPSLQESLKGFCGTAMFQNNEIVDTLLTLFVKYKDYDINEGLTEVEADLEELRKLTHSFTVYTKYYELHNYDLPLLNINLGIDGIKNALNNLLVVEFRASDMTTIDIDLLKQMEIENIKLGLNKAIIHHQVNNMNYTYYLYFYLYDSSSTIDLVGLDFDLTDHLPVILGEEITVKDVLAMLNPNWQQFRATLLLDNYYTFNLIFDETKFTIENVDTETRGMKLGLLHYSDIVDLTIPFYYFVYEEDKPEITRISYIHLFYDIRYECVVYDFDIRDINTIYILENQSLTDLNAIGELNYNNDADYDFKLDENYLEQINNIQGEETLEVAFKVNDNYTLPIKIKFVKISEEEGTHLLKITRVDSNIYSDNLTLNEANLSFTCKNYIGNTLTIDDIDKYVKEHYGSDAYFTYEIDCNEPFVEDYILAPITYKVIKGNDVLFIQNDEIKVSNASVKEKIDIEIYGEQQFYVDDLDSVNYFDLITGFDVSLSSQYYGYYYIYKNLSLGTLVNYGMEFDVDEHRNANSIRYELTISYEGNIGQRTYWVYKADYTIYNVGINMINGGNIIIDSINFTFEDNLNYLLTNNLLVIYFSYKGAPSKYLTGSEALELIENDKLTITDINYDTNNNYVNFTINYEGKKYNHSINVYYLGKAEVDFNTTNKTLYITEFTTEEYIKIYLEQFLRNNLLIINGENIEITTMKYSQYIVDNFFKFNYDDILNFDNKEAVIEFGNESFSIQIEHYSIKNIDFVNDVTFDFHDGLLFDQNLSLEENIKANIIIYVNSFGNLKKAEKEYIFNMEGFDISIIEGNENNAKITITYNGNELWERVIKYYTSIDKNLIQLNGSLSDYFDVSNGIIYVLDTLTEEEINTLLKEELTVSSIELDKDALEELRNSITYKDNYLTLSYQEQVFKYEAVKVSLAEVYDIFVDYNRSHIDYELTKDNLYQIIYMIQYHSIVLDAEVDVVLGTGAGGKDTIKEILNDFDITITKEDYRYIVTLKKDKVTYQFDVYFN